MSFASASINFITRVYFLKAKNMEFLYWLLPHFSMSDSFVKIICSKMSDLFILNILSITCLAILPFN